MSIHFFYFTMTFDFRSQVADLFIHHFVAGWNPITFTVILKYSFPTVQPEVYIDTKLELTRFIISPNKLLLTVSGRRVNLHKLPQHALIYIKPYTGHDNQNSPHRGQRSPVRLVLLLFNLAGFSASSASPSGRDAYSGTALWAACFLGKGLAASPTALQVGVLTCVPAVGQRASKPVIIIH